MTVNRAPASASIGRTAREEDPLDRHRLEHLLQQSGLTLAAASRRMGRNHAYLQQYVRRGSPRQLTASDRQLLETMVAQSATMSPPPSVVPIRCPWHPAAAPGSAFLLDAALARTLAGGRIESLVAMLADSDAMAPTVAAGDQLLLDTSQHQPDRDGLYALPGDAAPLIRRICLDPLSRRLDVLADNPAYPSQRDCDRRQLTIIGRVIWIGRSL